MPRYHHRGHSQRFRHKLLTCLEPQPRQHGQLAGGCFHAASSPPAKAPLLWGAGEGTGQTYFAKLGAPHRKSTSGSRPSGTGRRPSPSPAAPQPRCRPSPRRQLRGEPLKSAGRTPRQPGTETSAELRAHTALGAARQLLPARLGACLTAPHACPRPSRIAPVPVPLPPLPGCGADTAAWPGPAALPAPGLRLRPGTGRWRLPQRVAGAQGGRGVSGRRGAVGEMRWWLGGCCSCLAIT